MSSATSRPPDRPPARAQALPELVADGIVHGVALLAGLIAFPLLLSHVAGQAGAPVVAPLAVYAAGYFLMFGFSMAYNLTPPSRLKAVLRRFDHSAIYVMIAGTHTAVLAQFDDAPFALALGAGVWAAAALGVAIKVLFPGRYDRAAILGYVALGWVGIIAFVPASEVMPALSLWLLLAGGAVYVAGIGFYLWERLPFQTAIWHVFVATAAALHFAAIALAVA